MTFDTLAVANELKEAGFTPQQAEALARAWSHIASGELATKSDVAAVRTDLIGFKSDLEKQIAEVRQEVSGVKAELKTEIADVRSDVKNLRWMIGFALGLLVLILGKLFLIHV